MKEKKFKDLIEYDTVYYYDAELGVVTGQAFNVRERKGIIFFSVDWSDGIVSDDISVKKNKSNVGCVFLDKNELMAHFSKNNYNINKEVYASKS